MGLLFVLGLIGSLDGRLFRGRPLPPAVVPDEQDDHEGDHRQNHQYRQGADDDLQQLLEEGADALERGHKATAGPLPVGQVDLLRLRVLLHLLDLQGHGAVVHVLLHPPQGGAQSVDLVLHLGQALLHQDHVGDVVGLLHHLDEPVVLGVVGIQTGLDVVILGGDVVLGVLHVQDVAHGGEGVGQTLEVLRGDPDHQIRAFVGGAVAVDLVVAVAADVGALDVAAGSFDEAVGRLQGVVKLRGLHPGRWRYG